jgi:hypothetical protein
MSETIAVTTEERQEIIAALSIFVGGGLLSFESPRYKIASALLDRLRCEERLCVMCGLPCIKHEHEKGFYCQTCQTWR